MTERKSEVDVNKDKPLTWIVVVRVKGFLDEELAVNYAKDIVEKLKDGLPATLDVRGHVSPDYNKVLR